MPRRKRFDPEISAPVDGSFGADQIINKSADRDYVLAEPSEDLNRFLSMGYEVVRQSADGPRHIYTQPETLVEADPVKVRDHFLLDAPKELAERRHQRAQNLANQREGNLAPRQLSATGKATLRSFIETRTL